MAQELDGRAGVQFAGPGVWASRYWQLVIDIDCSQPYKLACQRRSLADAQIALILTTVQFALIERLQSMLGSQDDTCDARTRQPGCCTTWINDLSPIARYCQLSSASYLSICLHSVVDKLTFSALLTHRTRTGRTLYDNICSVDLCWRSGWPSLVPGRPMMSGEVIIFIRLLMVFN